MSCKLENCGSETRFITTSTLLRLFHSALSMPLNEFLMVGRVGWMLEIKEYYVFDILTLITCDLIDGVPGFITSPWAARMHAIYIIGH